MAIEIDEDTLPIVTLTQTEVAREQFRGWLAAGTLSVFAVTALLPILLVAFKSEGAKAAEEVMKVMQVVFAPVVGIVGTVVGFYFGSKLDSDQS
jgi:hypothetical protein